MDFGSRNRIYTHFTPKAFKTANRILLETIHDWLQNSPLSFEL
jgi:hypothetical protein